MKKNEKISFYCSIIASVCFFLSAALGFWRKDEKYTPAINFFLGTASLLRALACKNKEKDTAEQNISL